MQERLRKGLIQLIDMYPKGIGYGGDKWLKIIHHSRPGKGETPTFKAFIFAPFQDLSNQRRRITASINICQDYSGVRRKSKVPNDVVPGGIQRR